MPRPLTTSILIFVFVGLVSCSSTKNIAGTYRNKFAVSGFFGTTLRLMRDNSLQYVFQGDLIYDSITGDYNVFKDRMYLNFDKEPQDTTKLYYRFNDMPLKKEIHSGDTILYKLSYVIGHKKLFPVHVKTGKKVTKARKYNKWKKYLFFGSHYYDKKYYLKRTG